ncbi:MAG: tripartite tricarboxylate transporter substrate binding protein [Candidimonas sp.]
MSHTLKPQSPGRRALMKNAALLGAAALVPHFSAFAQGATSYPGKPVRILLGYPPGGSADVMTRLIADVLSGGLKQSFIVENKPGASGNIAAQQAAQASNDGYTLFFGNPAEMVINALLTKDLRFNPDKDFVPVVRVFNIPLALVVPANSPYQSLADIIEDAKKNPNTVTFASAGAGSPGHLAGEALAFESKVRMTHVPYKGAGPALTDVIGGHVQSYFAGMTAVIPHIKSGAIRVLALSSAERSPTMPDVPTVSELALPGFDFTLWGGLFARAGTSPEIIDRLSKAANEAYAQPELKERMIQEGSEATPNTPEEFGAFIKNQRDKYQKIIKDIDYTA